MLLRALVTVAFMFLLLPAPAWAQGSASLEQLQLSRGEDGLRLAYGVKLELPRAAEDALHKGVPLYFAAEARVARKRWY